jgi:hypothetical protein
MDGFDFDGVVAHLAPSLHKDAIDEPQS